MIKLKTRRKKTDRRKMEVLLDGLWSELVRRTAIRIKGGCRRCPRPNQVAYKALQAAHLFPRAKHTVRWDPNAGAGLCGGCHRYIDSHAEAKVEFAKQILGEEEYERLYVLSNMTTKQSPIDYKLIEIELRELLKQETDGVITT